MTELGEAAGPRVSADRQRIYFHRTEASVDLFVADRQ